MITPRFHIKCTKDGTPLSKFHSKNDELSDFINEIEKSLQSPLLKHNSGS